MSLYICRPLRSSHNLLDLQSSLRSIARQIAKLGCIKTFDKYIINLLSVCSQVSMYYALKYLMTKQQFNLSIIVPKIYDKHDVNYRQSSRPFVDHLTEMDGHSFQRSNLLLRTPFQTVQQKSVDIRRSYKDRFFKLAQGS